MAARPPGPPQDLDELGSQRAGAPGEFRDRLRAVGQDAIHARRAEEGEAVNPGEAQRTADLDRRILVGVQYMSDDRILALDLPYQPVRSRPSIKRTSCRSTNRPPTRSVRTLPPTFLASMTVIPPGPTAM